MFFKLWNHHIKFYNLQSCKNFFVIDRLLPLLLSDIVCTSRISSHNAGMVRCSKVIYKDCGRFYECYDRFFLYHCVLRKNWFSKSYNHGFRKSMVLQVSMEREQVVRQWKWFLCAVEGQAETAFLLQGMLEEHLMMWPSLDLTWSKLRDQVRS